MKPQSKTLRRIASSEVWGWPLFWFSAFLYAWLTFWGDAYANGSFSPAWILIYLVSFGSTALLAILLKWSFLDRLLRQYPFGVIGILIAGVLGTLRNVVVGWLMPIFGLDFDPQWAFRLVGGFSLGVLFLIFFGMSFGARIEHGLMLQKLTEASSKLMDLRRDSSEKLAEAREILAVQAREALLPKLNNIQKLLNDSDSVSRPLSEIRALISEGVRPLSENLQRKALQLRFEPQSAPTQTTTGPFFQQRINFRGVIVFDATLAVLPVSNLFLGYAIYTAPECWDVFFASVASALLVGLAKLVTPKALRVSRLKAALWLSILGLIAGIPPAVASLLHSTTQAQTALSLLVGSTPLVILLAFAWPANLDEDREAARKRFEVLNQELKLELSIFDQQLWLARRHWQFLIHGTVQSALTAALTRLQTSSEPEPAILDMVRQDLERAEKVLTTPPEHIIDLPASLAELQATWRGICNIRLNINERAARALQGNNDACLCVNEIVKEAVSNAVRHGQAQNVTVDVDRECEQSLSINVSNDGLPVRQNSSAGLGSKLIKELTTSWSLGSSKASGLTVLAASLPLAK